MDIVLEEAIYLVSLRAENGRMNLRTAGTKVTTKATRMTANAITPNTTPMMMPVRLLSALVVGDCVGVSDGSVPMKSEESVGSYAKSE